MKLVHWPLMGGLLRLVHRGGAWAGCGPAQASPRCTKCHSTPINQAPDYLSELCMPVAQVAERQHLRSASRNLLVAPRFQLNTYGRRAFAVAIIIIIIITDLYSAFRSEDTEAPATWNTLSDELRNPNLHSATFRRNLKTFLFRQYLVH